VTATVRAVEVRVHLLGRLAVTVDGVAASDFARRTAAQLIALLALDPAHRLHRERVMAALWPDAGAEEAANALHKAAHFARRATGRTDAVVLRGEMVSLFPGTSVEVDVDAFEAAARTALAEDDEAAATAALGLAAEQLGSGDRAGALRTVARIERVLREELGIGLSPEGVALRARVLERTAPMPGRAAVVPAPREASLARQRLGFCRAPDGVRLAYATSGTGPPLVKVANWLSHLDHDWGSPVWSHWWRELSRDHTLVRYDERGCGLSDWDVDADSFTLEAWVRDLETVVDTLGLERFPLLGLSQGGPIAVTYAARHPERVSHLVVYGTCARAVWPRASREQKSELAALGQLLRVSWGSDAPGFRQVYDAKFLPDGPLELWRAFDQLQRRSSSPENAFRLWGAFGRLDASEAARSLDVPTLILHPQGDLVWSFDDAEELHAAIPGSRLVALDTRTHILRADEPAFGQFLQEVRDFLGVEPTR